MELNTVWWPRTALLISRSRYYSKEGIKKKVPVDSVLGVFFTPSF
jgi:hypothetical protein